MNEINKKITKTFPCCKVNRSRRTILVAASTVGTALVTLPWFLAAQSRHPVELELRDVDFYAPHSLAG